jgi:hypothetical protein
VFSVEGGMMFDFWFGGLSYWCCELVGFEFG